MKNKHKLLIGLVALIILVIGVVGGFSSLQNTELQIPTTINQTDNNQTDNQVNKNTTKLNQKSKQPSNTVCTKCNGRGIVKCLTCGGTGLVTCTKCHGSGVRYGNGWCETCDCQSGKTRCLVCNNGWISCSAWW
ncbi:MAG: hypothetical protein HZC47_06285 [Methanobacterium sp.]|uniref:hypothetical protein n=1 Tax=Methanobacterium sp. TaxID=2164 RepID=UPI003D65E679|nr:hypothetical protein [Methanobacterium sp.]